MKRVIIGLICLATSVVELKAQMKDLQSWAASPRSSRSELSAEDFAKKSLSKGKTEKAISILALDKKKGIAKQHGSQWYDRLMRIEEYKMPFFFKVWGDEPEGGRSLYLSMHGGGGAPAKVNDKQYENQKKLYNATMEGLEGVYLAMRAPTDTWNLWHQSHIDKFLNTLIQLAVIYENVNPNKVYILGYSAGGDGAFQLAPRLADRWAAAAMMAGHPGDASALSLRNTPFSIHVGGLDSAYKRNEHAATWKVELKKLQDKDPEGYKHLVGIPQDMGHWMKLQDAAALPWMAGFTRNPIPSKVVWQQDNVLHNRFYWLEVPDDQMQKGGIVVAEYDRENNEVNILENYSAELKINLNDAMFNLDKPITVKFKGNTIYTGEVERNILNIWESLDYKGDAQMAFSASLTILNNEKVK
jgi:hypothetical protein